MYWTQTLKTRKATINPKNINKCLKYDLTVTLHHEEIPNNPERTNTLLLFIYNWRRIKFPAECIDLKKKLKKITMKLH